VLGGARAVAPASPWCTLVTPPPPSTPEGALGSVCESCVSRENNKLTPALLYTLLEPAPPRPRSRALLVWVEPRRQLQLQRRPCAAHHCCRRRRLQAPPAAFPTSLACARRSGWARHMAPEFVRGGTASTSRCAPQPAPARRGGDAHRPQGQLRCREASALGCTRHGVAHRPQRRGQCAEVSCSAIAVVAERLSSSYGACPHAKHVPLHTHAACCADAR
jgi:hypothetical protein